MIRVEQSLASPTPLIGAGRILVADDDESVRRILIRALASAGFQVEQATTGAEALRALKSSQYDVVLSDISMPEMTGLDLLRAVREHDLDLPVILMTGDPSVKTAAEAVEHGALRYLVKPVDLNMLVEHVGRALKLRRVALVKREALSYLGADEKLIGDRAGLEARLARAMETLWMAYQPIVDPAHQRIVGYEALVRTREPSLPNPAALFSAAERLGRVHDLGRAIRANVGRTMARRDFDADLFINLHPGDLLDDMLYEADSPLAAFAHRVVFEVTERTPLDHQAHVVTHVRQLRLLGFRIAIDDLGAGYAGLSYFSLLTPDVVKLDMSLIRCIHQEKIQQKLVGSLTSLCRDLGMKVVAEGIETAGERDAVQALGADLLQGYLFARPGPPFPGATW